MYHVIKANDKEYKLQFTVKAMVQLEAEIGKSVIAFTQEDLGTVTNMSRIGKIALMKHQPDIKIEDVYDIMDSLGLKDYMEAVVAALTNYFGGDDAKKKTEQ